jgi:hypothetical protein
MSAAKKIISKDGASMISARIAAQRLKCAPDYISKLCREGKLAGEQIDGAWFVLESSIGSFSQQRVLSKQQRAEALAQERRSENEQFKKANATSLQRALMQIGALPVKEISGLALGISLLLGASVFASSMGHGAHGTLGTASVSQSEVAFFGGQAPAVETPHLSYNPLSGLARGFSDLLSFFGHKNTPVVAEVRVEPTQQPSVSTNVSQPGSASASSAVGRGNSSGAPVINNYPVIERIVERATAVGGVTSDELTTRLQELSNSLMSQISFVSNPGYGSPLQNFAVSQVINNLNDTRLNGNTRADRITAQYLQADELDVSTTANFGGTVNLNGTINAATTTLASLVVSGGATTTGPASFLSTLDTSGLARFFTGLLSIASSTIGDGTQTGGLTISGGATTTGNAYVAGALGVDGNTTVGGTLTASNIVATSSLSISGLSTFANGLVSQASTTVGDGTEAGGLTISGGATTTGSAYFASGVGIGVATSAPGMLQVQNNAYIGGNLFVGGDSTTIGNSSSNSLVINSSIRSNLTPDQNITYDLGSSSFFWRNVYVGNIIANNISAASTTIAGTASETFTINSNNVSADTEDADLIFFRGSVVPNALLSWKTTPKRFEFNQSLFIQNASSDLLSNTTLALEGAAGQTGALLTIASSTGSSLFGVDSNGNVSAAANLTVAGKTNLGFASTTQIGSTGSAYFATAGGSVGIGTTTPEASAAKLAIDVGAAHGIAFGRDASFSNVPAISLNGTFSDTLMSGFFSDQSGAGNFYINTPQNIILRPGGTGNNTLYRLTSNGMILGSSGSSITAASVNRLDVFGAQAIGTYANVNAAPSNGLIVSGSTGIGTSSPFAKFAVHANNGETNTTVFAVASSTATATTTLFSVNNAGNVAFTGNLTMSGSTVVGSGIFLTPDSFFIGSASNARLRFENSIFGLGRVINLENNSILYGGGSILNGGTGVIGVGTTTPWGFLSVNPNNNVGSGPSFVVGSSTKTDFIVTNAGNVGIGTTTPDVALVINSAGATVAAFDRVNIRLAAINGGNNDFNLVPGTSANVRIGSFGSAAFNILSGGNVGIGTTTPWAKLSVEGTSSLGNQAIAGFFTATSTTASTFSFASTTALSASSNILIGTTDSSTEIAYSTLLKISGTRPALYLNDASEKNFSIYSDNNSLNFRDATAGVVRGVFDTNGNFGIGSTSPSSLLSIQGTNAYFNIQDTRNTDAWNIGDVLAGIDFRSSDSSGSGNVGKPRASIDAIQESTAGSLTGLAFTTGGINTSEKVRITSLGNVGIGSTTPFAKLSVKGAGTGTGVNFQTTNSSDTPLVTVLDNGSVGVGTTSPGGLFAVSNLTNSLAAYLRGSSNTSFAVKIENGGGTGKGLQVTTGSGTNSLATLIEANNGTGTNYFTVTNGNSYFQNGNLGVGSSTPFARLSVQGGATSGITLQTTNSSLAPTFTVLDSGNVGVGTTSPFGALSIQQLSSAAAAPGLVVQGIANNNAPVFQVIAGSSPNSRLVSVVNASGSEVFTVANTTNWVGVGTTSPAATFAVSGTGYFTGNIGIGQTPTAFPLSISSASANTTIYTQSSVDGTKFLSNNAGSTYVGFGAYHTGSNSRFGIGYTGSTGTQLTEVLSVVDSGNVGVGSTTPWGQLSASSTGTTPTLAIQQNSTGPSATFLGGNVGIGLANPVRTLDVLSSLSSSGTEIMAQIFKSDGNKTGFTFSASNSYAFLSAATQNGSVSRDLAFGAQLSGVPTEYARLTSSGNFGIGTTTPANLLDVYGTASPTISVTNPSSGATLSAISNPASVSRVLLGNTTTNAAGRVQYDNALNALSLWTNSNQRLTVDTSGNVGIGTTSPSQALSVQGNGLFSGNLSVASLTATSTFTVSGLSTFTSGILATASSTIGDGITGLTVSGAATTTGNAYFAGNVGIGTTTPWGQLSVNPNNISGPAFVVGSSTQTSLIVGNNGNVGIYKNGVGSGATPVAPLQVSAFGDASNISNLPGDSVAIFDRFNSSVTNASVAILGGSNATNRLDFGYSSSPTRGGIGYNNATDQLTFKTNSVTDRMVISSTGSVGIGTSTPASKLTVLDTTTNASGQSTLQLVGSYSVGTVGSGSSIDFTDITNTSLARIRAIQELAGPIGLAFNTWSGSANIERLHITGGGNVGIGTSTPDAFLQVTGSYGGTNKPQLKLNTTNTSDRRNEIAFTQNGTTDFRIGSDLAANNTNDFWIHDQVAGATRFFIGSTGNVGIGTTTPGDLLSLYSTGSTKLSVYTNNSGANTPALFLGNATQPTGQGTQVTYNNNIGDSYFNNLSTNSTIAAFRFQKGAFGSGTELMTIMNSGNVGIGSTTPASKLTVYSGASGGTPHTSSLLTVENSSRATIQLLAPNANDTYVMFGSPAGANRAFIGYQNSAFSSAVADQMVFQTAGSYSFAGGNVGIGTTTPSGDFERCINVAEALYHRHGLYGRQQALVYRK